MTDRQTQCSTLLRTCARNVTVVKYRIDHMPIVISYVDEVLPASPRDKTVSKEVNILPGGVVNVTYMQHTTCTFMQIYM